MYGISGENFFFKISTFSFVLRTIEVLFWIPSPKINQGTNFHEHLVNQTQNMNKNALPQISQMATKRTKERNCGPNFKSQHLRNYLR